jgi:mono/diheme cytochrome c family protein
LSIICAPVDHRAARAGHPDAVAVEAAIQVAAAPVLLEEGIEGGKQRQVGLVDSTFSASHAARCVACHGVRSHPVPVAFVGECSMPVV